jgi:lipopolysaccharide export LptBFGC system permease protein LptF
VTAIIVRAVLLVVAAAILVLLAAPFALYAEHRTTGKVVPAIAVGAVILVGATLLVVMP